MKKCKVCKTPFEPFNSLAVACSASCALIHGKAETAKKAAKVKKESRQWVKVQRERLKSKGDHTRDAQQAFNRYVRLRDYYKPCVSCGISYSSNKYGGIFDCGHYRSTGSAPHLRFNLNNTAKQCVKCNRYLSSNTVEYRLELISRIGKEKVKDIECDQSSKRWSIEYLKRIKKVFSKKSRILEKRISNGEKYSDCG